jgi:hypothetical protein
MDIIREHLLYKNETLLICMSKLTREEQYECIRIILASNNNVTICSHKSTNVYIDALIEKLGLQRVSCQSLSADQRQF